MSQKGSDLTKAQTADNTYDTKQEYTVGVNLRSVLVTFTEPDFILSPPIARVTKHEAGESTAVLETSLEPNSVSCICNYCNSTSEGSDNL